MRRRGSGELVELAVVRRSPRLPLWRLCRTSPRRELPRWSKWASIIWSRITQQLWMKLCRDKLLPMWREKKRTLLLLLGRSSLRKAAQKVIMLLATSKWFRGRSRIRVSTSRGEAKKKLKRRQLWRLYRTSQRRNLERVAHLPRLTFCELEIN